MTRRLLPFLPLLLLAVDAFARAGGGGGYHGGGGSHFSGGGYSGGGGGFIVDLYFYMLLTHPIFTILLTALCVWGYWVVNRETGGIADATMNATISRGLDAEQELRRRGALARIRQRDPSYDEAAFLRRATGAFLAIQDAWSVQDMSKARAFISDGVNERFGRQIAEYKERGVRNRMSSVEVTEIRALGYLAGPHYDAVFVGIEAKAVDELVSLADETVQSGGPDEFTEVWTFLRRPGAKSLARPGLYEGHCPSCGAALKIVDAAQCGACKVWVNSGEHDWVLTAITQVSEWSFPDPDTEVTGWEDLRGADPDLSLEVLEDRAAVVFWRWLDARRRGEPGALRGVATDEFVRGQQFGLSFERDAAVGVIETMAFEAGTDFDTAHVMVRWEADAMRRGAGGEAIFDSRERRKHFLIFTRRSGATSDPKSGLSTARCPACGAAPESGEVAVCAYCGRPFNDPAKAWILKEIAVYGEWRRPAASTSAPVASIGLEWGDELPAASAVAVLAAGLAADGRVDDRERAFLVAYAEKRGVDEAKVKELLAAAMDKRLEVPKPADAAQAEAILRGLIRMFLADGVVTDAERALLGTSARTLGLSTSQTEMMIKEERLALHARATAALAARRGG